MSKFYIEHYGTPRHSGRYPWGSGKNPQRSKNFLQRADDLADQGLSKKEIAEAFGLSTGDYVAMRKIYKNELNMQNQMQAVKLHDKGWSNTAIAERLDISEGTVRNMLDPTKKQRENEVIKDEIQSGLVVSVLYPDDPKWDFEKVHDYCYERGFTIYPGKISTTNTFRLCSYIYVAKCFRCFF